MTGNKPPGGRADFRSGFSLIELLVVVLLFSLAAVIVSQTFVSFQRLHRKVSNTAVVGQDMRFAMEFAVRTIRNTPLDYSLFPGGVPAHDTSLSFRKSTGETIRFSVAPGTSPACGDTLVTNCLVVSTDGGATFQPMTAKRVNVKNFDVYVRPGVSPFSALPDGSYANNVQPFVTINLGLEYIADNPRDNVTLQSQTTVASRIYSR